MIDKKIIKEKIFTNLKNYYPDRKLFIKGVTFVKNERARVLRYDLFEDDNKINEIYVKILKEGVKEQVLELKKLNEQRDLLLMPRILDFFEDFNAVVMEGFQGATLTKTLIFYTLPIAKNLHENRLLDIVKYIGRALGFLHNFTEKGKLRIGDMNLGIINGVKINPYIRTLLGTDLFNIICNRIGEIENERVSFVQVHRDPTPHNILVKGDDVCFVDFSFSRGASFEDPLTFSTGLELMSNRLPYFSKLLQEKMNHIFYKYYEKVFYHQFEENLLSFLKLLKCLQQLNYYNQRKKRLRNYIVEYIDKKYLLDRILDLSQDLNLN